MMITTDQDYKAHDAFTQIFGDLVHFLGRTSFVSLTQTYKQCFYDCKT